MPEIAEPLEIPNNAVERLSRRSCQLYSLPAVALRVLELTRSNNVDVKALKECIERDPALTGKLLRVVNSSLFGLSGKVSDLNQALALLGLKPLQMLVLGFSLPDQLFENVSERILSHYWRHSLTKAVAAKEIAEKVWGIPGDEAWVAGLLQDLGMLVLVRELGEPYVHFLGKIGIERTNAVTIHRETMGFDPTTLTVKLLESWCLPQILITAIDCLHVAPHWDSLDGEHPNLLKLSTRRRC